MFTHKISSSYACDGIPAIAASKSYTAPTEVGYDGVVSSGVTNFEVDIAFIAANVIAMLLYSSQALTVKTNDATTPIQTLTLVAGLAVVWGSDHAEAKPIPATVTKLFLTNATEVAATVKIRVLVADD